MRISKNVLISLPLAGVMCASAAVHAEETREACRGDAIKLCPDEVTNRDRPAIRRCIREHYRELSERCQDAIKARKEAEKGEPKGA